jgi:daunorubicin resistance ABC transporter ATP-binding subunit
MDKIEGRATGGEVIMSDSLAASAATTSATTSATTTAAAPAIAIDHLRKVYGTFVAVEDLSVTIEPGEIFGLLGPNGSGKTTTVNMVSGLAQPTSGRVTIFGHDLARDPRTVRTLLGVVPQETALYEELSAGRNMEFHAVLYGVPKAERERRIAALLELVQLADRRGSRVGTFSGGMKRRIALARALIHDPRLLYLDEPTLGVDVQSRRALWDYILDLKARGKTVLITTNYLEEANTLCDRLAILDHGRLIALDTPANLKQRYGGTVIEMETEPPPSPDLVERLRALPGIGALEVDGATLKVTVTGERSLVSAVINAVTSETELRAITQREPNLDEVFLQLTGSALRD